VPGRLLRNRTVRAAIGDAPTACTRSCRGGVLGRLYEGNGLRGLFPLSRMCGSAGRRERRPHEYRAYFRYQDCEKVIEHSTRRSAETIDLPVGVFQARYFGATLTFRARRSNGYASIRFAMPVKRVTARTSVERSVPNTASRRVSANDRRRDRPIRFREETTDRQQEG